MTTAPPPGYEAPLPGERPEHAHYYLEPQPHYNGGTPQYMVMIGCGPLARILAERCFTDDATAIVDALRLCEQLADNINQWETA